MRPTIDRPYMSIRDFSEPQMGGSAEPTPPPPGYAPGFKHKARITNIHFKDIIFKQACTVCLEFKTMQMK